MRSMSCALRRRGQVVIGSPAGEDFFISTGVRPRSVLSSRARQGSLPDLVDASTPMSSPRGRSRGNDHFIGLPGLGLEGLDECLVGGDLDDIGVDELPRSHPAIAGTATGNPP